MQPKRRGKEGGGKEERDGNEGRAQNSRRRGEEGRRKKGSKWWSLSLIRILEERKEGVEMERMSEKTRRRECQMENEQEWEVWRPQKPFAWRAGVLGRAGGRKERRRYCTLTVR